MQEPAARGPALTEARLADAADAVQRAVAAAFPGGLPAWDPVLRILEGRERPEEDLQVGGLICPASVQCAGRSPQPEPCRRCRCTVSSPATLSDAQFTRN